MNDKLCYSCFQEKPAGEPCPSCGYDPKQGQEDYPLALAHGTILNGQYILGRVLGQGGFGVTYVAQEWQSKKLVAVKEYLPDGMATRTGSLAVTAYSGQRGESFLYGKECFLKEAQTLAEFIGNPNIVRVHSYFEENGTAYFVMDYVEGISFQKHIRDQGGKVGWQEAQRILLPVMGALGEVHNRGIIHRDVTPDNVFITQDGTVKLLDFGAARYSLGDRSRSLDVVLKHGFAPREQYTRHGRQGPYTDVYSVAASFYYAITGRKPPDAIDRMDEDYLALPSSLGIDVPAGVEDAILKGISVHPSDRFQRMEEFMEALVAVQAEPVPVPEMQPIPEPKSEPVQPEPESVPEPKAESFSRPEPESVPEPKAESFSQPEPESVPEPKAESFSQPESVPVPEPKSESVLQPEPVSESAPESESEPKVIFTETQKVQKKYPKWIIPAVVGAMLLRMVMLLAVFSMGLGSGGSGGSGTNLSLPVGNTIAAENHTVGLKTNGRVVAVGWNEYGQCGVTGWTDIVSVSAGGMHTVGLKTDGTVRAAGSNGYGQCDVTNWTDIMFVSAGASHTAGLKTDGTVVAVGNNEYGQCEVADWTDIASVSAGTFHTAGLKTDGTVVAVGVNQYGQCDVRDWTDIVSVSAGGGHTVGLKTDGTVVAVGNNSYGQCEVADWTDIVSVSTGFTYTVGLQADGTVVAVGDNSYGQCDVRDWTDIVSVSAGYQYTVGLQADGTVMAVGDNEYGQCEVADWTDIAIGNDAVFSVSENAAKPESSAGSGEMPVGNTSGNLNNGGEAVFSDGIAYFAFPGQGIVSQGGEQRGQLVYGDAACLNLVQNVIYYLNGSGQLCRVNTDGSEQEILVSESSYNLIVSEKAFYTIQPGSSGSGFDIYRIERSGHGIAGDGYRVATGCYSTGAVILDADWLYYSSVEDYGKTIYRVPADGHGEKEVFYQSDGGCVILAAEDSWLYAAKSDAICRVSLSDGTAEELMDGSGYLDGSISGMNVLYGTVYYTVDFRPASGEQSQLYKVFPGSSPEVVYIAEDGDSDSLGQINVLNMGGMSQPVVLVYYVKGMDEDILWVEPENGNDFFLHIERWNFGSVQSNNPGNLNNFGFAAENEDYCFFTVATGILRVDKSAGSEQLLPLTWTTDLGPEYLNIYGDWIYYLDSLGYHICRVSVDGAAEMYVSDCRARCYEMCIVDGWLYCSYSDGNLTRRQIDSLGMLGAEETIVSDSHYYFTVDGDWIYYVYNNSIYRVRVDGTGKELVDSDGAVLTVVDDGWLYGHTSAPGDDEIFRIDTAGGSREMLYSTLALFESTDGGVWDVQGLSVQDDQIYFAAIDTYNDGLPEIIYRMNTDGTDLEALFADENGSFISCNLLGDQLVVQCDAGSDSSYQYYYYVLDLLTWDLYRYG